jgi:hypothetical protein
MRRWVRNRGDQLSALGEIHVHDEDDLKRLKEIVKLDSAHPMKKPRSRVEWGWLLPGRWEVRWPILLQGVCSAIQIQLSDRRDRVLLLVLSFVQPSLIRQVDNPHL